MSLSSKYSNDLNDLAQALINEKICVFETDTVVGLGCIPESKKFSQIYKIKKRPLDKKIPWLVSDYEMAKQFGQFDKKINVSKYWPGAITLVVNSTNNNSSLALRQPNVKDLITVMKQINKPIACTSANISGKKPVSFLSEVDDTILNSVDFVYTKSLKVTKTNSSSKIIDITKNKEQIIRF